MYTCIPFHCHNKEASDPCTVNENKIPSIYHKQEIFYLQVYKTAHVNVHVPLPLLNCNTPVLSPGKSPRVM